MKKHIIILLIMTLFAGMTLSAQEDEVSQKKALIDSIKRLDDKYLCSLGRDNKFETAKTNAHRGFNNKVKDFASGWTFSEEEWEEMKDGVYKNIQQLDYEKDGVWRVFVYVDNRVVYSYLPSRYKNGHEQNIAEASAVGKSIQKEDDVQMTEDTNTETEVITQDDAWYEEDEADQEETGGPAQDEIQTREEEAVQEEPKQEAEEKTLEVQETLTTKETPLQSSEETEIVEILPDVGESAVKLSSYPEVKYVEEDTTGITEFMRSVKKCEKAQSVRDLVAYYKKDGLKIEYKKPASPQDITGYYLVVYLRDGPLLAILSPSEKGEVIDILSGEPDNIKNYFRHKPAVSLEGFKFINEE